MIKPLYLGVEVAQLKALLRNYRVHTVCEEARCPNIGECFARRALTFMILGDICTRNCTFCAVHKGHPAVVDGEEAQRIAALSKKLQLRHIVITSVTRDDLPDGGAGHFARVITTLKETLPEITVEVLTPDFHGDKSSLAKVVAAAPHIFGHNMETVPRLYSQIRPGASYQTSLELLRHVKEIAPAIITKSSLMLGLGEKPAEVLAVMRELRQVHTDCLVLGQYLQPTINHLPVARYLRPEEFDGYQQQGYQLGFRGVKAAPFARSSYEADILSREVLGGQRTTDYGL